MKITCQTCQSKYTVSDEKVQGKTVKIKCRKCGATILVNSSGVTTNGATGDSSGAAADAGGAAQGSFLVNVTDADQRSMSLKEIIDAYQASVINADTYVWADGMSDWTPLGQVQQIVTELQAATGTPVTASAPPPAASVPRAAARRDTGRRADVFGGGGEAQAEVAAAPAAGLSAGLARATPVKHDENSVLFSLSALTARVGGPAVPQTSSAAKEDSGLIDLKALAQSSTSASPAGGLVSDTVGLFPLGMPAAPVLAQPILIPPPAPPNRAPVFIALGGVVAIVAIVGAFLFMKEGGKPPPTPATTVTAVAPPPLEPAETKPVETAAAPSASASVAAKPPPRWSGRPKAGATSGGTTTTPAGGETKTPVKSSGGCGCAPGDLMCAMKCSTKK